MAIKRRIRSAKELINAKQSKNIGGFLSKLEHSNVADVPDIVDVLDVPDVLDVAYVLDVPWTCRTSWTCRASRTGHTSWTCQTSQTGRTSQMEKGKRPKASEEDPDD